MIAGQVPCVLYFLSVLYILSSSSGERKCLRRITTSNLVACTHLPVTEHQLRTRQARRLLADVLRKVERLDDRHHGSHHKVAAALSQIRRQHFAVSSANHRVHFTWKCKFHGELVEYVFEMSGRKMGNVVISQM